MVTPNCLLAIDQGTTSSRAVVWDFQGRILGHSGREFPQHYPRPGWVEHNPEEIWYSVSTVIPEALARARRQPSEIAAIGITNQRETVLLWDRADAKPVTPAIVWQDRRTTEFCQNHKSEEPWLMQRTGLVLDPYFSASKIRWLLDQDSNLGHRAAAGKLAATTVDSFLLARLTGNLQCATDVTNASRTQLFNIHTVQWDKDLARFFQIDLALLPEVRPSAADYGTTHGLSFLPDGIPIRGIAGDQQAALFGHFGVRPGDAKCTYGTGAFLLVHTGRHLVASRHRLITTMAATIDDHPQYALEGSIFVAGAAIQWLRDGLKLLPRAAESEDLARQSNPEEPVIFVPGLVGLGAPYWAPDARGMILGLTRSTTGADLARAALEGVAFQVADLIEACHQDNVPALSKLRVDGGMADNSWFLQCQADLLGLPILRGGHAEATAWGAASLAGIKQRIWNNLDDWLALAGQAKEVSPQLDSTTRAARLDRWRKAIKALLTYHAHGPD